MSGRAGATAERTQRGQALVEFAVSSVFLLVLLAGMMDISRAFHYTIGLQGAVRAGARHGAFYQATIGQQPYLDDTDIKAAVDQVLAGDGLSPSVLQSTSTCIAGTDGNIWNNPPYAATAYPTATNSPWLYLCYDTQGAKKGTLAAPPAPAATTYTGTDLLVVLVARYGLIGGLSTEYLKQGAALTSIQLTAFQHFSVQG